MAGGPSVNRLAGAESRLQHRNQPGFVVEDSRGRALQNKREPSASELMS